jgi:hypothetical protein
MRGGLDLDLQGIKSADLSVGDLLNDFYVVPSYQREYVWSTTEIERLLLDIQSEYSGMTDEYIPEYFIGTIVTHHDGTGSAYELIDGQQRVTTLYVFLVAMRDFLIELDSPLMGIDSQLVDWVTDDKGKEILHHRVELQYEDSQGVLALLVESRDGRPIDGLPNTTRSSTNLVQAYRDCRAFLLEELQGDADQLRRFYAYVTQHVKLIRIRTDSVDRALWIFETINARGRGLDAMDLLKNLLFRAAGKADFEKLKTRWKALIDTLFAADERPIGFIRYYLLANFAHDRIQADKIYGWLTDPKNENRPDFWSNPVVFTNELLAAAQAYVNFSQGNLEDGTYCRYLKNIWFLSHTARQHLILMLAARKLPTEAIIRLAREIESLYFVFIITGQSANIFEKDFVAWAVQLRSMTTSEELDGFLENVLIPRRQSLRPEFEFALANLREENLPRYRLKYVLGKLAQYLDELAYGVERDMSIYAASKIDIEHILSIAASEEDIHTFGGVDAANGALHRLANLTLLERTHNAVVSNKSFADKQATYALSNIILTKGLAQNVQVGDQTKINSALRLVGDFDQWNDAAFERREKNLISLAGIIWDVHRGQ